MKSRNVLLAAAIGFGLAFPAHRASAQAKDGSAPSSCVSCHLELDGDATGPAKLWAVDVHAAAGLGCESCHGGDPSPAAKDDPDLAMDPKRGFAPPPDRLHLAEFCGKCHADAAYMRTFNPQARVDQLAEYRTSVHGQKNAAGDPVPATCVDCHDAHGIRPVGSPDSPVYASRVPETCSRCHSDAAKMAPYGIPTNQYEKYRRSVHASALLDRGDTAAPACNDCHGNHGAAPPGVSSVANVCGQCHGREALLFGASFKKELFDALEVPECTACHDNHQVLHPTPELFHSGSAPEVSVGAIAPLAPFTWSAGELGPGSTATARWIVVLRPHVAAGAGRYAHPVEITMDGAAPLTIDATVNPGDTPSKEPPRTVRSEVLTATLRLLPISGEPVEAGDAVQVTLFLETAAGPSLHGVAVKDLPSDGLDPVLGSACLSCHSPGDKCDEATEKMHQAVVGLDNELRRAAALLHRAELDGMEVSGPLFELKSKGTTAAVESRALIHSFDPDRLVKRTAEGSEIASQALGAGESALAEIQYRRKGLFVFLGLVCLVLVGLYLKIRQVSTQV